MRTRLSALTVLVALAAQVTAQQDEDLQFYRQRVQPILEDSCYQCHGTRDKEVGGHLWLRTRQNVLEGGDSGPIIDLVDPEMSRLLRYVNHADAERQMPPDRKLPAAQIEILTEWVTRGAPMPVVEGEWVYERPSLFTDDARAFWSFQPIANPAPPEVRDDEWCRTEIDQFVLHRLERAGLTPNGDADRTTLIRRATYGLTGLPPTIAEIQDFVMDESDDAYEKLIDRLLASPRYGEHWGRHWLDLVRFAETNGYERDGAKPEAWRYRQYVIDALNADKPYDRFVLEQLAGDELDDADAESVTATGYYRLGLWDDEPADPKQAILDGLDDVVSTTGEVFLGLTMGCARCHDHKLDPIPQADYYRMLSFFQNIRPYSKNQRNILADVATPAEKRRIAKHNEEVRARRADVTKQVHALRAEFSERYREEQGVTPRASDMSDLRYEYYRSSWDKLPDFDEIRHEASGPVASGLFDLSIADRTSEFGFVFRGKLWVPEDGEYTFWLDSDDGSRLTVAGEAILLHDGIHGLGSVRQAARTLTRGHHDIRLDYFQKLGGHGLRVDWAAAGSARRSLVVPDDRRARQLLDAAINEHGARLLGAERAAEYQRLSKLLPSIVEAPTERRVLAVTERRSKPARTHVMIRGSAHAPGDPVDPGFPQILTSTQPVIEPREETSGRRLAFARWLVNPENQLTARVIVNRVWQFHMGHGLVRSPSNLGMQGRKPTHPQLLDRLARAMVADGWSLKKLHRRIMLSSVYRQSSVGRQRELTADPTNELLWRFDMRRLSAEEIRDSILSLTGTLNLQTGGASVYPELPPEVLAGQSRVTWPRNRSPAHNTRRTVYTFVKRSLLDPFVESFDAATTDTSCAVRFQTTQPTQALALLNSALINKAATRLAARLRREVGDEPVRQVALALRLATGRSPREDEVLQGVEFIQSFPEPAEPGQALQQFCLIVLSLNEFLFVD